MIFQHDELSFQILGVGLFRHQPGLFSVKARPYSALSFRLAGSARFEIEGKCFSVSEGDLTFIPAHMPYKVEYSGGESIVFHLLDCNYGAAENHTVYDTRRMETLFHRALADWEAAASVNLAKANVYSALYQLDTEQKLPIDDDILLCIRHIETHYTDPSLTVDVLCKLCHISRSTLQRKCRRSLGTSPGEYILKRRLSFALSLLMHGEPSVKAVAHASGFSDEKYFSRAFRTAFGYSPREAYHL